MEERWTRRESEHERIIMNFKNPFPVLKTKRQGHNDKQCLNATIINID
jgi:hypothetical protein